MFNKVVLSFCLLGLLLAAAPVVTQAQAEREISQFLGEAGVRSGLGARDIRLTAALIIGYSLSVLGIIFIVLMTYAGFLWMTAGGEEEKITKARKLIFNSIIALAIVLAAFGITVFVFRAFVRSTTNDPCYEPLGYQRVVTGETIQIQSVEGPMANIFCR